MKFYDSIFHSGMYCLLVHIRRLHCTSPLAVILLCVRYIISPALIESQDGSSLLFCLNAKANKYDKPAAILSRTRGRKKLSKRKKDKSHFTLYNPCIIVFSLAIKLAAENIMDFYKVQYQRYGTTFYIRI